MATFDKLAADKRAILELVLQQGKSYEDLSDLLGLPPARVRELARDALGELAPATARRVEEDWRGQVADYVLLQQSGPEASATRGHLKRSEAARVWAMSLLDSLDELYGSDDRPQIPDAEPERDTTRVRERARPTTRPTSRAPRERPSRPAREPSPLSGDARQAVRRRRIVAAAAAAAAILFAVLVWPIGILGGDDDEGGDGGGETTAASEETPVPVGSPIPLQSVQGEQGEGVAVVAQRGGDRVLIVTAAGLTPSEQSENRENPGTAYEVWLYNSRGEAVSIGAQVTDQQGNYQGAGPLPGNFREYRFIDVSRERIDDNAEHSGDSVLRGRIADIERPLDGAGGGGGAGGGTQTTP